MLGLRETREPLTCPGPYDATPGRIGNRPFTASCSRRVYPFTMQLSRPQRSFPLSVGHVERFDLTRAEEKIAGYLLAGFSNKEIAEQVGRCEATVKNQIARILAKSGTESRVQFIAGVFQELLAARPAPTIAPIAARPVSRY